MIANVINIAADLGGMAEAARMVTGAPVALMVPVFGLTIVSLLFTTAVINGVLAPPLILIVLLLTGDPRLWATRSIHALSRSLAGLHSR